MGNFNKNFCMKGCRLKIIINDDTHNMYQFIFNSELEEVSDIYSCETNNEFEVENDGTYYVVTIKVDDSEITENGLRIGSRIFTSRELYDIITSENQILNIGVFDVDEVFSICKLKKCLAELELKAFQESLKNCGSKCKNKEMYSQRDFIFIAVWLIEHYINLGNLEKARLIYESIKGCGSICKDLLQNKKGCGCNG